MKKTVILLIIVSLINISVAFNIKEYIHQRQRVTKLTKDIDLLIETLEENHPHLYKNYEKKEFVEDINELKSSLSSLSNKEIQIQLATILAKLSDGHTGISLKNFTTDKSPVYPFQFEWFGNELKVIHTTSQNKDIIGSTVLAINGLPIEDVMAKINSIIPHDSDNWTKANNAKMVVLYNVLFNLHIIEKDTINWTFRDKSNHYIKINVRPIKLTDYSQILKEKNSPLTSNSTKPFGDAYGYSYLENGDILYVQFNKGIDNNFTLFSNKLILSIQNKNPDAIIFDLRRNTGGDSSLMSSILDKLKSDTDIEEKHNYLLIGKSTFSSGVLNAYELKQQLNAIIYGEDSGQSLNQFGEVRSFKLPYSKIEVYYSTKEFILEPDSNGPLKPDVYCEQKYRDYINLKDSCIEGIIQNEEI
jgi:C-terminal processing protease CtpA/Prc